jgi:2-polyprenyl-6-methoxyphenol hydroxylase-like FAD-dependent oxidoreductase
MKKTPVLIIGAGPTGLTLACELAKRNIAFRIIERSREYPRGSRAKGVQPRSLEILNELGIVREAIEFGSTTLPFRRFNGNMPLGDVQRPDFPRPDTQFTRGLIIPQWKIEELLRAKLSSFGVVPELGTELLDFTQSESGVDAVFQQADASETLTCDWMVACDGGKSNTRRVLQIPFAGETHEDERMLVGDVEIEGLTPDAWHIWPHPVYGFGVALCPFAHTNTWQIQAIALPDERGHLPEPTLETFNRIFQEMAQMPEVVIKNSTWQSLYRVNVRMAEKYRVGRVFIAGDAAHAHSIAGGLGMNTGIQDAFNLGWKLAAVLQGADPALLDTYEEERLPIAAWTLNISSSRQKAIMDAKDQSGGGMAGTATKDTTQLNLNYRHSSLSAEFLPDASRIQPPEYAQPADKQQADNPADQQLTRLRAGDRAPDAKLADGSWLFDVYRGPEFVVLGIGAVAQALTRIKDQFAGRIKTALLTDAAAVAAFGGQADPATPGTLFVIRPDGYIGLIAAPDQGTAVADWLRRIS